MPKNATKKKTPIRLIFFLIIILAGLVGGAVYIYFEKEKPLIEISQPINIIGPETNINFTVTDKRTGLRKINLFLIQGDKEKKLRSIEFPLKVYWLKGGPESQEISYKLAVKNLGFKDGQAQIVIEAEDYSFSHILTGNRTQIKKNITIDTKPPRIHIIHTERYIEPGGSGFVIYRLSDDIARHGVQIGDTFHPGFPIEDERDDVYNSLFAIPYNMKELNSTFIVAIDKAGNRAISPFSTRLRQANQQTDQINIGDSFLKRKIPEFEQHYPEMQGELIEKYLYANNKIRTLNNKRIKATCSNSTQKRLWKDRFLRMAGSSRAGFADHRTYYYKGRAIDKQVHLGMDIASTKRIGIKAAGKGKVVLAEYLGIYGNTIILDHGMGLFTLYAHLSQINIALDDIVEKSSIIGLSGTSGMAGGDHLHFSVLVNGVFVNPIEWWDQHWIEVTIQEPIIDSKF